MSFTCCYILERQQDSREGRSTMPNVTLEHVFPATYTQAPVSAIFPTLPNRVGTEGTLCVLWVRYGSDESRTRQICVFLSEHINFKTDPGIVSRGGDLLTHLYCATPKEGVLREPLRDDLTGEYMNAWHLNGPENRDQQVREELLETIRTRWRVLRRAEMGKGPRAEGF